MTQQSEQAARNYLTIKRLRKRLLYARIGYVLALIAFCVLFFGGCGGYGDDQYTTDQGVTVASYEDGEVPDRAELELSLDLIGERLGVNTTTLSHLRIVYARYGKVQIFCDATEKRPVAGCYQIWSATAFVVDGECLGRDATIHETAHHIAITEWGDSDGAHQDRWVWSAVADAATEFRARTPEACGD